MVGPVHLRSVLGERAMSKNGMGGSVWFYTLHHPLCLDPGEVGLGWV